MKNRKLAVGIAAAILLVAVGLSVYAITRERTVGSQPRDVALNPQGELNSEPIIDVDDPAYHRERNMDREFADTITGKLIRVKARFYSFTKQDIGCQANFISGVTALEASFPSSEPIERLKYFDLVTVVGRCQELRGPGGGLAGQLMRLADCRLEK